MTTTPRALVMSARLDGASLVSNLDQVVSDIELARRSVSITNTAAVLSTDGKEYSLYRFEDEGTKAHLIGEKGQILANRDGSFGPITGPVRHPGTAPRDLSARIEAYLDNQLERLLSFPLLNFAGVSRKGSVFDSSLLNRIIQNALDKTISFAQGISNSDRVKAGYEIQNQQDVQERL